MHAPDDKPRRMFEERHGRLTVRMVEGIATLAISPLLGLLRARRISFVTGGQILSLVPGAAGIVLRRAWYRATLEFCGQRLRVGFGAAVRDPRTRFGDDCTVGDYSVITRARCGSDVLIATHVTIQPRARRYDRPDVPLRLQTRDELKMVDIGDDVWIGAGARVLADVASHSIVGAGAVVVRAFPEWSVLGGVPAQVIGDRQRG